MATSSTLVELQDKMLVSPIDMTDGSAAKVTSGGVGVMPFFVIMTLMEAPRLPFIKTTKRFVLRNLIFFSKIRSFFLNPFLSFIRFLLKRMYPPEIFL